VDKNNKHYEEKAFIKFSSGLFSFSCSAQKFKTFKDHCGLYHKHMDDLYRQKGSELFYHFQAGQTVACIGPQCCHWEAAYAASTDSVKFYLEDIDSAYFSQQQAAFAWNYYNTIRSNPISSTYQLIPGDEKKINLPDKLFDKVLIINSFHEDCHSERKWL